MRENNRNPIERCRKRLPQFTTMNVIDGQAGLVIYSSLIFYSLTIDNILNIIVLLILAGVTIATLTGDNGILNKVSEAQEKNVVGTEKELVGLDWTDTVSKNKIENIEIDDILLDEALANQFGAKKAYSEYGDEKGTFVVTVVDTNNRYLIDSTGKISDIEEIDYSTIEGVVAIGNVGYETLQQAIDTVATGDTATTIVFLEDIQENVEISEQKNIVLNLNGKTLTKLDNNKGTITNYGTIQVKNGTIKTTSEDYWTIELYGTGECEIYKNVTIEGGIVIWDQAYVNVVNGNIDYIEAYPSYENESEANMDNITISGGNIGWISARNYGNINITGGYLESIQLSDSMKCTITGGKIITSYNEPAISVHHRKIIISGDAYIENNSTEYATINLRQPDDYLEINGGTIINKADYKSIEKDFTGATVIINNNPVISPAYEE